MKVVLDTNILVSGIFFGGGPGEILDQWAEGILEVYATPPVMEEYLETIEVIGAWKDPLLARVWMKALPRLCHVIPEKEGYPSLSRDPDDDKFLACAHQAGASYLVTGDGDLLDLKEEFPFKIISPRDFLKIL